ncbi:MAG: LptA/OstA family protein [Janthinobacterium lividum]
MRHLLLALLLLGPAVPAGAQAIDMSHGGPVEVTASDGMEWRQNEQVVIARGSARAVRGDVTVTADVLIAHYRKKAGAAGATPAAVKPGSASLGGADTGSNEIYRLEAEGNVHIFTATDLAVSDRAIYDIDQSVLLLTGSALKITTPQQVMTARDAMEYWSAKHMAVGRGVAVVTTSDGRRVAADTLVAYTKPPDQQQPAPKLAAAPAKPGADPLTSSGKLERVEGFGNVEVRTATETIHADRGVYVADTGIARLLGNVHLTRGQNQLNGDEAIVNMHTGISTLSRNPGGRIQGLVVPNDATTAAPGAKPKP